MLRSPPANSFHVCDAAESGFFCRATWPEPPPSAESSARNHLDEILRRNQEMGKEKEIGKKGAGNGAQKKSKQNERAQTPRRGPSSLFLTRKARRESGSPGTPQKKATMSLLDRHNTALWLLPRPWIQGEEKILKVLLRMHGWGLPLTSFPYDSSGESTDSEGIQVGARSFHSERGGGTMASPPPSFHSANHLAFPDP